MAEEKKPKKETSDVYFPYENKLQAPLLIKIIDNAIKNTEARINEI